MVDVRLVGLAGLAVHYARMAGVCIAFKDGWVWLWEGKQNSFSRRLDDDLLLKIRFVVMLWAPVRTSILVGRQIAPWDSAALSRKTISSPQRKIIHARFR